LVAGKVGYSALVRAAARSSLKMNAWVKIEKQETRQARPALLVF
jgi:hypothetical protein